MKIRDIGDILGLALAGLLLLIPAARAAAGEGPAPDVPQLKVLDAWVGTWDFVFDSDPAKFQSEAVHATGTETARWTLKGRFLERTTDSVQGESRMLQTYDPGKRAYRSWFFNSSGITTESLDDWDATSRTMTHKHVGLGGRLTATATTRFLDADHIAWDQVIKDESGTVVVRQRARWTRRK